MQLSNDAYHSLESDLTAKYRETYKVRLMLAASDVRQCVRDGVP